jgi:AraC family transcriptional regulator
MSQHAKISAKNSHFAPARFLKAGPFLLAGLRKHYNSDTRRQIPDLWHEVGPHLGKLPAQVGKIAYGVCLSTSDDNDEFDYLASAEVSSVKNLPPRWTHIKIPAQRYAVFPHDGSVSEIPETIKEIFQNWLPDSDYESAGGGKDRPNVLERYGEGYDPATGRGDIEIWLPVKD